MPSLLWITLGFLAGAVTAAVAIEFAWSRLRNDERVGLHRDWSLGWLADDGNVKVVSTHLGVPVPPGSLVIVPPTTAVPGEVLAQCEVRTHDGASGNVATGSGKGLVLTGPIEDGTLALMTTHPAVVSQLERSFESLWVQARPYIANLEDVALDGALVGVRGRVTDVLRSGSTSRLTVETTRGNVLVQCASNQVPSDIQDVEVKGRMRNVPGGRLVVAEDLVVA